MFNNACCISKIQNTFMHKIPGNGTEFLIMYTPLNILNYFLLILLKNNLNGIKKKL